MKTISSVSKGAALPIPNQTPLTLGQYCSHQEYTSDDAHWDRIVINGGILPANEMTMLDEQIIVHLSIDSKIYRENLNL